MGTITLPDGSQKEFSPGSSVRELIMDLGGKEMMKDALAAQVGEALKDLSYTPGDEAVEVVTPQSEAGLKLMRHSAAHVMAEAITQVFPGTKLAYGPAVEDGFFYDVDSPEPITEKDIARIQKAMKKIVKKNAPFTRVELSRDEARGKYSEDEYKLDNIERAEGDVISFYTQGEFEDLCRGPHVPSTRKIGAFKVMSLAGAYWHGDETKQQLTRVYGTCWPTQEELDNYLNRIEEAKKRDHRKLGRELGLFEFHPEASGMAFWRPGGVHLYRGLENYLRELGDKHGYEEIRTPQILNKELWLTSGHWANYADKMYTTEKDGKEFGVKPMNCPGGVILYKAGLYSHNDLPLRWAEFGHVHRYESGGEIHGLVRVRGFTQDDAHIFCTPEQLQKEIEGCIKLVYEVYETVGLSFHHIELSTRPEKSIGTDEMWSRAESALQGALENLKIDYKLNPGDGAFYGPKIDFHLRDAIGRTWQMGTIQVDFAMPENFDMHYVDAESQRQRPVMIHRAISGSLERFLGVLTEHYAGDFPLWLAPEQVRILTVTDESIPYGEEVLSALKAIGIRAKLDSRGSKIGAKIRDGELAKVPYLAIIGSKEAEARAIAGRRRMVGDLGQMPLDEFVSKLSEEISSKTLPPKAE